MSIHVPVIHVIHFVRELLTLTVSDMGVHI